MELHDVIGSFGPWQRWMFLIVFYLCMVGVWQNLAITFFAPNVPFRCVEPPPSPQQVNLSSGSYYDRSCSVPHPDYNSTWVPCTRWEYEKSVFSETFVSEWDLVCSREWLISLLKSVYMLGFLFSVIFFGQMSDSIGRFRTVVISFLITIVSMFVSLLSSSYTMFAVLRFFQAFGRTGMATVSYVLVLELVGSPHRTAVGIGLQLGWSLGFCTLAAIAWYVRHWFWLQLIISLPYIPLIITYCFIPESPRWLITQRNSEKLEKLMRKAAKFNNKEIKANFKDLATLLTKIEEKGDKRSTTLLDVMKRPTLRKTTLNMIYLWLVNAFMYYALTYNTNDLAGDPYLNFFVAGLLEFPSYGVLYWGIRRYGRRPTLFALSLGIGFACAAVAISPQSDSENAWVGTAFSMMGKFCVTASFGLLYLYTSELYPTVVRNSALGTCSMFARFGSILAPFVRELGQATHPVVPNILYATLAVSSGVSAYIFVPETSGKKLPDTIEEAEQFM